VRLSGSARETLSSTFDALFAAEAD
jgi:hypothetical protein